MTVLAVAILSVPVARAEDPSATFLYVAAGAVRTSPGINQSDTDASLLATGITGLSSSIDNGDVGFKVQVGWTLTKNISIETGYVGLGSSRYRATFTDGTAKTDFKAGGIVFDFLGVVSVSPGTSVFGKLGLIAATVVNTSTVNGPAGAVSGAKASESMFRPNIGAGAIYDLSTNVSVRLEAERYFNLGSDFTGGTSNMDMVSVGVVIRL